MIQKNPKSAMTINLRFVIRATALALALIGVLTPFLSGILFTLSLTVPVCGGSGNPSAYGLIYDDVQISAPSINAVLAGYFLPAAGERVKGTIIGVPTGASGRADRLHELRVFIEAGYNVIAYQSRTCAVGVSNSLGGLEVEQVGDVLAYLAARDDIDMARVGIHGFSAGGATAMMAGGRYPQIAAVVAQGGYHDFWDEIVHNTRGFDRLPVVGDMFRFGARIGYRLTTGVEIDQLDPLAAVQTYGQRPILLVYGTTEPGLRGALIMRDAASRAGNRNIELWQVPGAGHGDYVSAAGEAAYRARIVTFWDQALTQNE